jgi:hypothetical protein
MSGVFQNIDPPPPLCLVSVYPPPPRLWCGGRKHSLGGEGGGGSIFWKTPDTALYSTYVSTLYYTHTQPVLMVSGTGGEDSFSFF